jgi:hypothetical protein
MRRSLSLLFFALFLAGACGPSGVGPDGGGDDDDDDDDSTHDGGGGHTDGQPPGAIGTISGTVWAPGNAPGMVPDGEEIPISGAIIYVQNGELPEIPDHAYCDTCQEHPPGYAVSDAKGNFQLSNVPAGNVQMVIEKAQFRLARQISVSEEIGAVLTPAETTLPSRHDPDNGEWIPKVAIAVGDSDHVEDIFGKMGILEVDSDGATVESSFDDTNRVEIWGNPIAAPFPSHHQGTINQLFSDVERMKDYHIIFVPCNFYSDLTALSTPAVRQNIREYVDEGGKLYITDWSAEWEDSAFPEFITFDTSIDTTKSMADSNIINNGDGDFGHFALHASASDPDLASWLDDQHGPIVVPLGGEEDDFPSEYTDGVIDANDFVIEGSWTLIRDLPTVRIGVDTEGNPVDETAKEWISGDYMGSRYPHTVTFEPSCGRVLYSTYHTAQQTHRGLVAQERVLLYLIMEIGVCNDGPIIP